MEDIVQYVVLRVRAEGKEERGRCASGSVVEYRLAKARVAGSNPVSRFVKEVGNVDFTAFPAFCSS